MNMKEAIEFVKCIFTLADINYAITKRDEVIERLQRGEKYEAIEKGIKQYCLILENQNVLKEIIRLEQKYFPKKGIK